MENTTRKRILVLGGGFAGLTVARELERKLACGPSVEITLINRDNSFLFTPMLHEVAASDLDLTTIVNPVRKMLLRVNFLVGRPPGLASLEAGATSALHAVSSTKRRAPSKVVEMILPEQQQAAAPARIRAPQEQEARLRLRDSSDPLVQDHVFHTEEPCRRSPHTQMNVVPVRSAAGSRSQNIYAAVRSLYCSSVSGTTERRAWRTSGELRKTRLALISASVG